MLGWNNEKVNMSIVHCAKQSVFCEIHTISSNNSMFCTFVYAANGGKERKELWKDLHIHKRIVGNNAWVILGDMNVTLNPNEHSTGSSTMSSDMNDFKDCINSIEVEDIVSSGLFFTWTKNLFKVKAGDATGVLKKLDRIMVNEDFLDKYPQSHATFLPKIINPKRKTFKFANFIADKKEFIPTVSKLWETEVEGCQMFKTIKKLKELKRELRNLTWKDGNVFYRVKTLKNQLVEIQSKINKKHNDKELRMEESKCLQNYVEALKDEEKLMYQKAKIKWLSFGDRNNAFFHKVLKSRKNKSRISAVRDSQGNQFHDGEVAKQFVKYFQEFLGNAVDVKDCSHYITLIKNKLSSEEACYMIREIEDDEIKEAISDVCNVIKEFFITGKMLKEINSTIISLIPKIQAPDKVTDFRPIACCNGYERKEGPKRVSMKVDIQKAYDTVNWKFLEAILKGFGFHDRMFKGGRGLRQVSPYLFTLVMEMPTLIIHDKVDKCKEFYYHFGCKKMKLTHVCFADDLLMFYHGDRAFVIVLKQAIEEFSDISGLLPNYNKSTILFGSMKKVDQEEILKCVPFKIEKWPIKYLGVPLSSKRLQLIASILESIHVYWASVFLLPKTVIKDINCVLKKFMWNQGEVSRGKANVAWKNVCKPKVMGGLGLKDLEVWNKCMIIRHLRNIANDKKSLWVKWVNTVKLQGNSIWAINEDVNDSWGWKNILKIRDEVRNFMIMRIGNGEKASVIYDSWCGADGQCRWPGEWIVKYHTLILHKYIQLDPGKKDTLNWSGIVDEFVDMYCGNDINSIIRRMSLAASVYLIWHERNCRIFRNEKRSSEELFDIFNETIRMRLTTLKAKKSTAVTNAQKIYNILVIERPSIEVPCILESTGQEYRVMVLKGDMRFADTSYLWKYSSAVACSDD
ncbi:RNA-directed DNA polymerase, eukaryota, reverse transcriptase zinc-binding domain protein [Tanacetum coccineum]